MFATDLAFKKEIFTFTAQEVVEAAKPWEYWRKKKLWTKWLLGSRPRLQEEESVRVRLVDAAQQYLEKYGKASVSAKGNQKELLEIFGTQQ